MVTDLDQRSLNKNVSTAGAKSLVAEESPHTCTRMAVIEIRTFSVSVECGVVVFLPDFGYLQTQVRPKITAPSSSQRAST